MKALCRQGFTIDFQTARSAQIILLTSMRTLSELDLVITYKYWILVKTVGVNLTSF